MGVPKEVCLVLHIVQVGKYQVILDYPGGGTYISPEGYLIFTFDDHLLTISHAMYLVSNKVALNKTKNTIFLHAS